MHVTRSKKSAASLAAAVAALGLGLVGPATPVAAGLAAAPAAGGGCLSAPANARQMGGGDGTDPNSVSLAETKAMEAEFQAGVQSLPKRAAGRGIRHASYKGIHLPKNIKIDTYVHVITRADGTGGVTDKMIRDQIKVMNDGYAGKTSRDAAGTPFQLQAQGCRPHRQRRLVRLVRPRRRPERRHRGQDGAAPGQLRSDLNIYIAGLGDNLLGYAYYPNDVAAVAGRPGSAQRQPARAVRPRRTTRATPRPTRSGTGCSCSTRSRTAALSRATRCPTPPYQARRRQHLRVRRVPGHVRPARDATRSTTS